jgi:hypothetical protein
MAGEGSNGRGGSTPKRAAVRDAGILTPCPLLALTLHSTLSKHGPGSVELPSPSLYPASRSYTCQVWTAHEYWCRLTDRPNKRGAGS